MSLMYTGSTMQVCPWLAAVPSLLPKANIITAIGQSTLLNFAHASL